MQKQHEVKKGSPRFEVGEDDLIKMEDDQGSEEEGNMWIFA